MHLCVGLILVGMEQWQSGRDTGFAPLRMTAV
jgi:hypothetical protein